MTAPRKQMADALFQNRLDAVWAVEPFLTIMLKSGIARVLAYPYLTWIAKFTGVKLELVAAMNLPDVSTEFSTQSLKANLDLAVSQRLVKPFDVETMVWKP